MGNFPRLVIGRCARGNTRRGRVTRGARSWSRLITRAALWAVAFGVPSTRAGIAPIPHDDDTAGRFDIRPAAGLRPGFQPLPALGTPTLSEILSRPDAVAPYRLNEDLLAMDPAAERALFASPPAPSGPRVRILTRGAPQPAWATPVGWTPAAEWASPVAWTPPVPKSMRPYPDTEKGISTNGIYLSLNFLPFQCFA